MTTRRSALQIAWALALLSWGAPARSQPIEWKLDPTHTHVGFIAQHLAMARVRGHFDRFDAKILADAKTGRISGLEASAETASVNTEHRKRDEHLRSADFLDAAKHPKLRLKLKSIRWVGNDFIALVALTLRGITQDVEFKGALLGVHTVNFGNGAHTRMAYEAKAEIMRRDFGIEFNGVTEGLQLVGPKVEIVLELEATVE